MAFTRLFFGGVLLAASQFLSHPGWTSSPLDIGSRLELFVDRHIIATMEGTHLRLHRPTPAEDVLFFDNPWEGKYSGYVTVIKDGDLYRMYYRGLPEAGKDGSDLETTCYAESGDGVKWSKPNLGLHKIGDSWENNAVLFKAEPFSHNFSPFVDSRPDVPESERFKALGGTSRTGLVPFVSADGIRWEKLQEEPVITEGAFDSQNVSFWSESEEQYVCYFRTWSEGEWGGFRSISRVTSPDFINWSEPVEMSYGDTPREHLYTNQTRPYFRAPHIYISTAARFFPKRRVVSVEEFEKIGGDPQYSEDCSDAVLMTSRGGASYDRTFMEAFIRPGIGAENWTSRTNYPALGVVPTGRGEMSAYVQRGYGQPTHHVQRLVLRTDGFASVHAPYAGGEMKTVPLTFEGNRLVINYSTSAAGSIRVEVLNMEGEPIEGFSREDSDEIIGDEIERTASWKGSPDVGAIEGATVCIVFVMKDADLYSIRFTRHE